MADEVAGADSRRDTESPRADPQYAYLSFKGFCRQLRLRGMRYRVA